MDTSQTDELQQATDQINQLQSTTQHINQLQDGFQSAIAIGSIVVLVLTVATVIASVAVFVSFMRMMGNIAAIRKILEHWEDERNDATAAKAEA